YLKVGDVQGRPYRSNLGQTDGALASYRKALATLEPLSAHDLADVELRRDLATAYERIGNIQLRKADFIKALDRNNKALAIRQTLSAASPSNANYKSELADSYIYVGDALQAKCTDLACIKKALESQRQALVIREALAKDQPSDLQIRRDIAQAHMRIGFRLSTIGAFTHQNEDLQQA